MSAVELELIDKLVRSSWRDVKGMMPPSGPITNAFLDVVFFTDNGAVRLTGKDHIVADEMEEAFSLAIHEHTKEGWWEETEGGTTAWKPTELLEKWKSQSLSCLMDMPREIRFYSDPRLKQRTYPAEALLDDCSAIKFARTIEGVGIKKLVLRASGDSPCCVEIATSCKECDRLLEGLEEISPGRAN